MRTTTLVVATMLVVAGFTGVASANSDHAADCSHGHANPSTYGAVYAGTDDCGFSNGGSTIGSPAELPDQNPHDEAPW